MKQVFINGQGQLAPLSTRYIPISGGGEDGADFDMRQLIPTPGILSDFRIQLDGVPLPGKTYTSSVRINGVDTPLKVVNSGADIANQVHVVPGDMVNISVIPYDNPSAYMERHTLIFTGDNPRESLILGNCYYGLNQYSKAYMALARNYTQWSLFEEECIQIIPTSGRIKNMYMHLKGIAAEGSNSGFKFTLRLNGVDTPLSCTILGNNTDASNFNSVPVAPGDRVTLQCEPINAPGGIPPMAQHWGFCFEPDIDGESIILQCIPYNIPASTSYNYINSRRKSWDSLNQVYQRGQSCTLKKLFVELNQAPGVGKSYTFTLIKNGSAQPLSVVISGDNISGYDGAGSFILDLDDDIAMQCVPSGNPNPAFASWGLVSYNAPAAMDRTLNLSVSGQGNTSPPPGSYQIEDGGLVTLAAFPEVGNEFIEWEENGIPINTDNPVDITMDADRSITAIFGTTIPLAKEEAYESTKYPQPASDIYGVLWKGQTFTPVNSHDLSAVALRLCKTGLPPNLVIEIYLADVGHKPVGSALRSIEISPDFIPPTDGSEGPEQYGWSGGLFSLTYPLVANTEYVIVARTKNGGGDGSNSYRWAATLADEYPRGVRIQSTDGGVTWSVTDWDFLFQEFSEVSGQFALNISTMAGGTTNPAPGGYFYDEGATAIIEAIPDSGYQFVRWEGDIMNTENPLNLYMTRDYNIVAIFELIPAGQYTLNISTTQGGTTSPPPGSYLYDEGATAMLTAVPDTGYQFVHWELPGGGILSTNNPHYLTMDQDWDVIAIFELIPVTQYTLVISSGPNGTTNPAPGSYLIDEGTVVSITALVSTWGYEFAEWREGGVPISTMNPLIFTMNSDRNIVAIFRQIPVTQYTLDISVSGQGTTSPAPGPHVYNEGVVTLVTALPDAGHQFVEWQSGGIPISTNNPISITMNSDLSITAIFEPIIVPPEQYAVTISVIGQGTTNPAPGAYTIEEGSFLTITANPSSGWIFDHWSGNASGTDSQIIIEILSDISVIANFVEVVTPPPSQINWFLPAAIVGSVLASMIIVRKKK